MRRARRSSITLVIAATAIATATATALLAPTAHASPLMPIAAAPSQPDHAEAIRYAATNRDAAPPGSNDMNCAPSAAHPNPVVLVHGTDGTAYADWAGFSPILRAAGFCVFAINYGASPDGKSNGYGVIESSAAQLKSMTESILQATGAAAVDLVGYSQGAAVTRYFVNRLGGDRIVDRWVGMASPTYGGTMYGATRVVQAVPGGVGLVAGEFGPGLTQLMAGSEFLERLNAGGDTVPGVEYTSIATKVDEVIQPYTNALFRDPGAHNIVVQDECPDTEVAHFTITYDPTALRLALNALDPVNARAPNCVAVPLGAGILDVVFAGN